MNGLVTVMVADDHPLFRRGLIDLLESEPSFRLVGEAGDGEAALALARRERPAVALLDIDMPQKSGLAVAEAIRAEDLGVEVVMLTMYRDGSMLRHALDLGARGYVLKDTAANEILACVHTVASGRAYISPALSTELLVRREKALPELASLAELTPTERRVLHLIATGLTSAEIAASLGNREKTIENHRTHICRKLDLHGPQALLRFALERKALLE